MGIAWRCIDFETALISIEQQANAKRKLARVKTQTAVRRIEAPDWLISMFRELKISSPHCARNDLVFATSTGSPHGHGNVLARGLYPALDRAGLPRTSFHSLRHSHASLWIKDGGDVITLSKRLGHATPQVTMSTYADEIEEANDNAVRKAPRERPVRGDQDGSAPGSQRWREDASEGEERSGRSDLSSERRRLPATRCERLAPIIK